jgi:adenylate cyclase
MMMGCDPMPVLTIHPDGARIDAAPAETILSASLRAGVPHMHACGGHARCSTCRVLILGGRDALSPRNEAEAAIAERLGFPAGIRLACQTPLSADTVVRRIALDHDDQEWIVAELDDARGTKPVAAGCEERAAILFADLREAGKKSRALFAGIPVGAKKQNGSL